MDDKMLLDLQVLERKKYNLLNDVMDLSQQLATAMDRNDQVSVRMLVAMRQDPLTQLEEVKHNLSRRLLEFSPDDQDLAHRLLQGGGQLPAGAGGRRPVECQPAAAGAHHRAGPAAEPPADRG